jgi:DNA invertase Pin-like site-specific DNA recombinase
MVVTQILSANKPAILYIRFSSDRQADGDSIARQTESASKYAKANGYTVARTITDEGESAFHGLHLSNGHLGKFLTAADKGTFKGHTFFFEELTRLSRQGVFATLTLITHLLEAGLMVRDIASGIEIADHSDLDKPQIALLLSTNAVLGRMHSHELSRKISHARQSEREQAAKDNKAFTPICPAWIKAKAGEKAVLIEEHANIVCRIFDLAAQGYGAKTIVRMLIAEKRTAFTRTGKWTPEYITSILKNRAVLGYYQPHKLFIQAREGGKKVHVRVPVGEEILMYPPAITMAQWEAARTQVDAKNRNLGKPVGVRQGGNVNSILSPLVYDADLGRLMNFYQKKGDHPYLVTKWAAKSKSNYLRYDHLEMALLGFLSDLDWQSVATESESLEVRELQTELETTLIAIDRHTQRLAAMQKFVEDGVLSKSLWENLDLEKAALAEAVSRRQKLTSSVTEARAKVQALYSPEQLLTAIRAGDAGLRLRLKEEIQKRITRIDVYFKPQVSLPAEHRLIRVRFINGIERWMILRDMVARLWQEPNKPSSAYL